MREPDPGTTARVDTVTYDYIIVGGGSAGCVLANRLSARPENRVLLVESGPDTPPDAVPADIADVMPLSYYNKARMWKDVRAHWRTRSTSPSVVFDQGRVMGGSSSVMGMIALRGCPADYEEWVELGAVGWGWSDVLPYFKKLENDLDFDGDLHGASGPVPIRRVPASQWPPLSLAMRAFAEESGMRHIDDMNADFGPGAGTLPMSNWPTRRASSALCYLTAAVRARPNLEIWSDATASQIVLAGRRAIGIRVAARGEERVAKADTTIICGGAILSPALLMRSGLGPAAALRAAGLPIAHDLPGVGRNLQNHPVAYFGALLRPGARQSRDLRTIPVSCLRYGSGFEGAAPLDSYLNVQSKSSWNKLGAQVANLSAALLKPFSRGWINPGVDDIVVEFNFMDDERDLRRLAGIFCTAVSFLTSEHCLPLMQGTFPVSFTDRLRKLNRYSSSNRWRASLIGSLMDRVPLVRWSALRALTTSRRPLRELVNDEAALNEHIKNNVAGLFHPVGTCRMGALDSGAVVDSVGQVHNIAGLRVVDASIMPSLPSGNTNIPVIMVAEKIADTMSGRRG